MMLEVLKLSQNFFYILETKTKIEYEYYYTYTNIWCSDNSVSVSFKSPYISGTFKFCLVLDA